MPHQDEILAAVELGSGFTKVLIAEIQSNNDIKVIGAAQTKSQAIDKGVISDSELAFTPLENAHKEALAMADLDVIDTVTLAITGDHLTSEDINAYETFDKSTEITPDIVASLFNRTRDHLKKQERTVVGVTDKKIILDEDRQIFSCDAQSAKKIDCISHVIFGDENIHNVGVDLVDSIMDPMTTEITASSLGAMRATTTIEERQEGTLVIDIGAQTCDFALAQNDKCYDSGVVALGGDHIANDLALAFDLYHSKAKELLHNHGAVGTQAKSDEQYTEAIPISSHSNKRIPLASIQKVIELRLLEIFSIIREKLQEKGSLSHIGRSVVLTGGVSQIPGIEDIARQIFKAHVRCSQDIGLKGPQSIITDPSYAACAGLIIFSSISRHAQKEQRLDFISGFKRTLSQTLNDLKSAFRF